VELCAKSQIPAPSPLATAVTSYQEIQNQFMDIQPIVGNQAGFDAGGLSKKGTIEFRMLHWGKT
jgi:hypothetical protein